MDKVWLTQHLDARYGKTSREIMLYNLAHGTRILAPPDGWDRLRHFEKPAPLEGHDQWLERAHQANILVSRQPELPDFVRRLRASLCQYLGETRPPDSQEELLRLVDRAEEKFRQKDMPKPFRGNPETVGPVMQKPERLVAFMFDHTRTFLEQDLFGDSQGVDLDLVRQFFARPAMKLRYEQQFCTPRTTQLRAQVIGQHVKSGDRVLVLGDDDLVSLALIESRDDLDVDVLELDTDLVAFLKELGGDRFTVLEHNLRHGVPESMQQAYDLVTTDPPYAADGMRFFLSCARQSLANKPTSRLFLTTFPGLIESPERLWSDLDDLGFTIENTHKHFSRYIYNNTYRVDHLAALRHLGSPLRPCSELLGFPYLYAHFFECSVSC